MASSAISRAVWEESRFDEDLKYSEDIDWTWRARQRGYLIKYVPDSIVMHSHNYTLKQFHKRHYGEGRAETAIFEWSSWESSFLRYSLAPYARQILSDWKYCIKNGLIMEALSSPVVRLSQLLGRRKGFKEGLREKTQ